MAKNEEQCEIKFCRNISDMVWLGHKLCDSCYAKYEMKELKEMLGDAK